MTFTKIASLGDIPPGEMKKVEIDGAEVTLANIEGTLFAFEDRCPHMNSPLHKGRLEGREVVCPFHKARFDVTTGKKTGNPRIPVPRVLKMGAIMAGIRTHDLKLREVKVVDGAVYIA